MPHVAGQDEGIIGDLLKEPPDGADDRRIAAGLKIGASVRTAEQRVSGNEDLFFGQVIAAAAGGMAGHRGESIPWLPDS